MQAHVQSGLRRECVRMTSSSLHPYHILPRRIAARASRAEVDRYSAIRTFFSSLRIEHSHRLFSTSSNRQEGSSDNDKDRNRESSSSTSTSQGKERVHVVDSPRLPFHNYPRSLRELAIRSREEGSSEDKAESQTALNEHRRHESQSQGVMESSESTGHIAPESSLASYSRWTRTSRPTKEDLLRFAQGFWTRMRIRFKWFTIRGFRRFNADDISAFFTLGGLGTVIFVIVGTTTAVSLVFSTLSILNMQEWIARKIADYLTHETGVTVIFENAIVPKWKDSRICFQNVFISRRAYGNDAETLRSERLSLQKGERRHKKRPQRRMTAVTAGQGMAWEGTHFNEYDEEEVAPPMSDIARGEHISEELDGEDISNNFSMFDLNVDSIEVKLSFNRWLDGKGLVEDAVVQGVRGIIDRRNVFWDPDKPYDPREARKQRKPGGFELASLTVNDFLVTVYQPGNFRPFNLSIFEAKMPKLRRQWMFYDILGADRITGQVDGCLFSLHKPQSIGRTTGREREIMTGRWKTLSRLRIDGINFDHIQNQSDVHGPVSWIRSGKFDVVADIKFPKDASSDIDINVIISEMLDNLSIAVTGEQSKEHGNAEEMPIPGQHRLSGPAIQAPVTTVGPAAEGAWKKREKELQVLREENEAKKTKRRGWRTEMDNAAKAVNANRVAVNDEAGEEAGENVVDDGDGRERARGEAAQEVKEALTKYTGDDEGAAASAIAAFPHTASVVIDLDVRFKDIKAAVPLFSSDLTYRTQTFVRPIVAFMNANQTLIPVHCRVVMDLSEFDGALDLAQTGLLPVISEKIYEALATHVSSQRANNQRIKSVSQWWLKLASDNILQYAVLVRDSITRNQSQAPGDTSSLKLQTEM